MNKFEWKTKKQQWGSHASLMYGNKVLAEIEYTDGENYGVYSDCFNFILSSVPYGKTLEELMDYVKRTIGDFCKLYAEWSDKKD